MFGLLDEIRARLTRVFRAGADAKTLAISGTGTSGMEAVIANLTTHDSRAVVVVNGYFGARLAEGLARYGAAVTRVEGEWGRAIDPDAVRRALPGAPADLVAVVHGETSTGVENPVADIARIAREHGALTVVDAVTSLGAVPVEVEAWGLDAVYSCSQKGLGAPSGLAPVCFGPRALERLVPCRSFYVDLGLLQEYWVGRKYHHTISAPLVFALAEALAEVEDEGLTARWQRHLTVHEHFGERAADIGLTYLPPEGERLRSLNAVHVPPGTDEAAVRRRLLQEHGIEVGAGLGPFAGKILRIGLMGSGATLGNVERLTGALAEAITETTS
jgi:alanine-glyoxylate transaminase/serine-glyoxylate transaminase/serine-pyruvate transaminase